MRWPRLPGRWRIAAGAAPVCLVALVACSDNGRTAPDGVARFDDTTIAYSTFETYLEESIGEPANALSSDVLSQLFDQFLEEEMLLHLARDRGIAKETTNRRLALMALLTEDLGELDQSAILTYYRQHREEFQRPERVRLAQILVDDRATAEAALERIRTGVVFERVAREVTQDPREVTARGSVIAVEDLPTPFAEIIAGLEAGEVSEVVEAAQGFHIFHLVERLPAQELPLSAVQDEIREKLDQDITSRRLATLVAEVHNRYNPRVYERKLPFNYQGRYAESPPQ